MKVAKYIIRSLEWLLYLSFAAVVLVGGYFAVRIYWIDQFIIPTGSMQPTLIPGDRVVVNKFIAGARIYDKFDFSSGTPMESHRTRGVRSVEHNDIVIFNFPLNRKKQKIEFEINYVYGKRCVGMPGDSVSIVDGFFRNNNYSGIIGVKEQQEKFSATPDSLLHKWVLRAISPWSATPRWTTKNFGPLYIPREGDEMELKRGELHIYKKIIEFETGKSLKFNKGQFTLGEDVIDKYIFTKDYYFLCGDNVMDSNDSRYWGFVPEEFIVGVVSRITYSRDRETDEFRWNRFMKSTMK